MMYDSNTYVLPVVYSISMYVLLRLSWRELFNQRGYTVRARLEARGGTRKRSENPGVW